MMVLTAYNQSTGSLVSPEGFLAKIITPVQGFVSQASQNISSYLYRVKLRSNIEYEYNQLKAQNDELTLRSILYEELEQENAQLRALLGEYETRSTMNPMLYVYHQQRQKRRRRYADGRHHIRRSGGLHIRGL